MGLLLQPTRRNRLLLSFHFASHPFVRLRYTFFAAMSFDFFAHHRYLQPL